MRLNRFYFGTIVGTLGLRERVRLGGTGNTKGFGVHSKLVREGVEDKGVIHDG